MAEHTVQGKPKFLNDRLQAYPNYDLPYRGLPAEIRTMIWRYYLIQGASTRGPRFDARESGESKGIHMKLLSLPTRFSLITVCCDFFPKLTYDIFRVSKEVYQEASSVSKGTLELRVASTKDRFGWLLSLIPTPALSLIGKLKTIFKLRCYESQVNVAG